MPGIDPISTGIGAITGLIGGIGKWFGRNKSNRQLDELYKQDPTYSINPLAKEAYGLAQTQLNARMPGATTVERNIFKNQAGQLGNISRYATDASQALALGAMSQGQTNDALENLGLQEVQDYQRRLGNLTEARQGLITEGDKVHNDLIRRFGDLAAIRGTQAANRQANWGDISNLGFGIMNFGMQGGFKRKGNNLNQGG